MSEPNKGDEKKPAVPPPAPRKQGLGEKLGVAGGVPAAATPNTSALRSQTLEGLLQEEIEAQEKAKAPAPPAAPNKPTPESHRKAGLGEKIAVAGGVPAPAPPNTSALRSKTLDGLLQDEIEAKDKPLVPPAESARQAPTSHPLQPGLGQVIGVAGGVSIEPAPAQTPVDLELRLRKPRTLFSAIMSLIAGIMSLMATVPLVSVLAMLIYRGGRRLSIGLFTDLPPAAGMTGGGIGNALVGTLLMVGIASAISVPFGILAAVFLVEIGPKSRTASLVRFTAKVLSGLPSVLAGLFAYATVVILTGKYSAPAGGVALAILMLPTILLTAEQAIKMVPQRMREAAIGMGCTQTEVVWYVVLPTALPGLLTGVMLAVARAAGETAPLLFTALFSDYWLTRNPMEPTASLAVLIFDFSSSPFKNQIEIAWAASLVVVVIILMANVAAQMWTARSAKS
jgi:phosphate transport system permease protein